MKTLQEKVNNWKSENEFDYSNQDEREFFEWLQGCEYPCSEVKYNGMYGQETGMKWYTLTKDNGESEDFLL